jgi:hypothetical protein
MYTLIQVIALFLILLMGTANAQQTSPEQSETGAGNHRFIIFYTTLSRLRTFSSLLNARVSRGTLSVFVRRSLGCN